MVRKESEIQYRFNDNFEIEKGFLDLPNAEEIRSIATNRKPPREKNKDPLFIYADLRNDPDSLYLINQARWTIQQTITQHNLDEYKTKDFSALILTITESNYTTAQQILENSFKYLNHQAPVLIFEQKNDTSWEKTTTQLLLQQSGYVGRNSLTRISPSFYLTEARREKKPSRNKIDLTSGKYEFRTRQLWKQMAQEHRKKGLKVTKNPEMPIVSMLKESTNPIYTWNLLKQGLGVEFTSLSCQRATDQCVWTTNIKGDIKLNKPTGCTVCDPDNPFHIQEKPTYTLGESKKIDSICFDCTSQLSVYFTTSDWFYNTEKKRQGLHRGNWVMIDRIITCPCCGTIDSKPTKVPKSQVRNIDWDKI